MIADKLWESTVKAALRGEITADLTKRNTRESLVKADIEWLDLTDAPFTIPAHWEWVKFAELVDFRIGKTPKRQESVFWSPEEIPWVSIADISREGAHISKTKESVSPLAFNDVFRGQLIPKGTLLMSFKLSIGKCAFLDIDAVHNEAIISIFPRLDDATSTSQYLSYALPVMALLGKSKNAIKGATLNKNSISNIPIPLPPPAEQKVIVKRLEVFKDQIDRLAELERERVSRQAASCTTCGSIDGACKGFTFRFLERSGYFINYR